jgi:hypothetical protein
VSNKTKFSVSVLVVLFFSATSHAQINKCTVEGKVVYQSEPCVAGGEKVNVSGAGKADANASGANYYKKEAERLAWKERVENAIYNKQVIVGMGGEEVVQSWGRPHKINTTVTAKGRDEQWVYRRAGGADQYLYLTNGELRSMQGAQ